MASLRQLTYEMSVTFLLSDCSHLLYSFPSALLQCLCVAGVVVVVVIVVVITVVVVVVAVVVVCVRDVSEFDSESDRSQI